MIHITRVTWYSQALAIIIGIGIFILGIYIGGILKDNTAERSSDEPVAQQDKSHISEDVSIQNFRWKNIPTDDVGEIPKSEIFLITEYSDGFIEETLLAVIDGGCNIDPIHEDLALNSEQITCYYAGLGNKFRVIVSDKNYLVQRKISEEAGPDYNPPIASFETILVLPKEY